jgi:hypothetical protein
MCARLLGVGAVYEAGWSGEKSKAQNFAQMVKWRDERTKKGEQLTTSPREKRFTPKTQAP